MSIGSRFLADLYKLPRRQSGVTRQRGLMLPMRDGVELETDHFAPKLKGTHPTILMRLPYGLNGFATVAEVYAERGFHVVLQSCRGTSKSGGEFDPLTHTARCTIGFAFPDGSRLDPAFDYRWRIYSIPELRDCLAEAGFARVRIFWDDGDDHRETEHEPDQDVWLVLVVAET